MKRSKWKQQRTDAGLRKEQTAKDQGPAPVLPQRAADEYRGRSLGFLRDRRRAGFIS